MPAALTTVHARISEDTPRDLRGVRMLEGVLTAELGVPARRIDGREGPFGRTRWRDDLEASRGVLTAAGAAVAEALAVGARPVTVASDCSLALGTFPVLAEEAGVLWLDAHADYDSPDTTTQGFLGCMSLAGACGVWDSGLGAIAADRVVHVGARSQAGDFDYAGQEHGRHELRAMLPSDTPVDDIVDALPPGPVYVHFDPDVLDPAENPLPYERPGGLSSARTSEIAVAVARKRGVIGLEVTAFHSSDDAATRERVAALIAGVVDVLLGRRT
jgi:arginase